MKKVVYSIRKVGSDKKIKGVGIIAEGDLLIPSLSSKGNPYIRVIDGVTKNCKQVADKENEYFGRVTVAYNDVPIYRPKDDNYEIVEYIEVDYYVWYKFVF